MGKTPPKGEEAEGSPPKKSPRRQDKRPAAAVPLPAVPQSSELIVKAAEGPSDKKLCSCNHVITYGAIMGLVPLLESKDAWTCCDCLVEDRRGIVKTRPPVRDLLICTTCYDHLCCGVGSIAYPYGHSRAHAREKEHWFAVLYCDPARGYCFKCNAEVPMPVKFGEGDNEVGLQVIRNIVRRKLLVPPPSVGALITASAPSLTGKTPPKGDEVEESPRKKAPRLFGVDLPTVPGASEDPNPKGKTPLKEEASDEKRCNCNHVIITDNAREESSAIQDVSPFLKSKDALTCFGCLDEDKKRIVKTRPPKSDLLICVTCCDHFCCGVGSIAYPFGHSRAHAKEKEHWFAVLYCDPERGFCFKCNAEVPTALSQKLLAPPPSVGQNEAEVNPKKVERTGKAQAESHPSGQTSCRKSRSSYLQGYAIRGLPSLGNTCYMNAVLQCLFVLGKLRERMLALNRPKSPLAKVLKKLFVEASAEGDMLNLKEVLKCVHKHRPSHFNVGAMEDSHEFLMALHELWNQGDTPTLMDSIFGFEMSGTLSCKRCGHRSALIPYPFRDLSMGFPPKRYPTKSAALPQTNESPRSRYREIGVQIFPADVQRNLEKMQTVSASGYSDVIGPDVIVDNTHKALEVDSTQAQRISQSKDVVQSTLQIQKGKSVDSVTEDSISIEDFLLFFSEDQLAWRCPNCAKNHEESSASQSKNGEQTVGSGNEGTTIVEDQTEQSDMSACQTKGSECHGSTVPAEKQTDLLGANQTADTTLMMHLETVKQSEQDPTAHLLKESKNEQKDEDDVGDGIIILRFTSLPPVLTLHLKRTHHETVGSKISGHVRFMEYLDVKQFMDRSSFNEGSTRYRLAGVVEHSGEGSLNSGHYIAHVRARRLGNQQEGSSCSSSWFCASDTEISPVIIDDVLKIEAYILFYERMETEELEVPVDSWEVIHFDENEIVDSCADTCSVEKLKVEDISWTTQLLYNKYNKYAANVFENNKSNIERLKQSAEWLGKFAPLVDPMLPVPVCSIAAKTSSHISKAMKASAVIGRMFKLLQSFVDPPQYLTLLGVANQMQAKDAINRWNASGQSPWYFAVIDGMDPDETPAVKNVIDRMQARKLFFLTELYD